MICPEASALSMKVGSEKTARPPEVNVFLPGYSLEPKWHGLELGVGGGVAGETISDSSNPIRGQARAACSFPV